MNAKQSIGKGAQAEETLRKYFLDLGYFVVRGIKFKYQGYDVTDVDLWLYMRPSALTRERVIVDIKRKRTPQAIERIFWTKGLQNILGLEGCIVATTDKRDAVREFGKLNGVAVLDGNFLTRLQGQLRPMENRLANEELVASLDPDGLGKLRGDWQSKIELSKSRLLTHLDFSGCNTWLADASFFAEQAIVDSQRRDAASRLLYLTTAFFLVALDYIFRDLSFTEAAFKSQSLRDGFIHGSIGKAGLEETLSRTIAFIENYLPDGSKWSKQLRKSVLDAFEDVPADVLKEFFSKEEISRALFGYAVKFEEAAYSRSFILPHDLDNDLKSVLGVLLDFSQIERRKFYDSFKEIEPSKIN